VLLLLLACSTAPDVDSLPNVVLVSLDTVRWDGTSLGGEHLTTPNLVALSELPGATTYTRAWSAAAWSLPSYASILTGQTVGSHGVGFVRDTLPPGQATLAEMLGAYGYASASFASGPHLHPDTGLGRGFDEWNHTLTFDSISGVIDPALEWAEEQDEPFLLFVQGYDAHMPYPTPAAVAERFGHVDGPRPDAGCGMRAVATCVPGHVLAPARGGHKGGTELTEDALQHVASHYLAAVHGADHQLGRLLYGLDQRGLLADSIVVVFSDHGEVLGGDARAEDLYHVPLVVRVPSTASPVVEEGLVSLIDILPSLADELGVVSPAGIDGQPLGSRDYVLAASAVGYTVRTQDWELELQHGSEQTLLYRPGEWTDRSEEEPEVVEELLAHLEGWPLELEVKKRHGPTDTPAFRDALRDGGYWAPEEGEEP